MLAGPAYGFGFEAVAHVYEPLWLGAYAEWGRPTLFSEVNPCTQGCSRSERMIGGVVGVVLLGASAAVAEALSPKSSDNVVVPAVVWGLTRVLL